ncbi:SRPBCC family protein [Xenophilus arseniciresistens]|uniref:SRPBCC family protein n=1 Tax=Xenophilus arseniciresistens TaxID=1283306 RepID=A0AAE3N6H8_9BURK|nr:SRPBCC family protein [Xenophilus arseniciresistens]MDA7414852.1 SRPBCC family protein [Xenophilus arseniciresistens]
MTDTAADPCRNVATDDAFELSLTRLYDAPPEKLFRAWTDPELLKQWFVPKPWSIARVEHDLRPGGRALVVMQDPDGNEYPNDGVFLEIVPNRLLVSTNAFTPGWQPADPQPIKMVAIVSFEPEGEGKTRYTARARHWSAADRETHEKMGFHEGWGICADQLGELVARL